jgi:hypothetical protein
MRSSILRRAVASVILTFVVAAQSHAELKSLETEDMQLIYFDPVQTYVVPHAARSFENSFRKQKEIFEWTPYERPTVLLTDFTDFGNAAANSLPRNSLFVDIAPLPFTFETSAPAERLFTIMNHELVHIATTDQAAPPDLRYRKLFGGKVLAVPDHPETILYQYLTTPRKTSPRWYLEGIAVFVETWMGGGLGRAQGGYDEMVFRGMVRDDAHFYDPLGLVAEGIKVDFQVGANAYLYGTRFMSYMAYTESPEKLIQWVQRLKGSDRMYSDQFRKVYGKELDQAWEEWIAWEHEFQNGNLAAIRQFPVTPHRDVTDRALGSVSRAYLDADTGELYAGIRYPGIVAHIAAISTADGSVRRLEDIKGPMLYQVTSLAFDPNGKTLFYTTDNYNYRDLVSLDLETGETRTLLKDARIGGLVFNPADRSLWGVRHLNGIVTLVRIPYPYTEWKQVHSFPYGQVLYDMDISPDGTLLSTSFGDINGQQSCRIMKLESLLADDAAPYKSFDFGQAIPEGFVFTPDGKYLVGSSYYTGVSNIFRYEIDTGDIEALSNAEVGLFRPVPMADGSLIVFRYTGQGFVPTHIDGAIVKDASSTTFLGTLIADKYPVIRDWKVGSPASIDLDALIVADRDYKPWQNMSLESIYPVVEGYKSSIGAGLNAKFSDNLGFNRISVTGSVTPYQQDSEQAHLYIKQQYQRLDQLLPGSWTTELKYNYADFYDIFGPTKVSRKGYSGQVTYKRPIISDDPRKMNLTVKGGYFADFDELPYAQDVDTTFDSFANASGRLDYSNVRKSLGAVDEEKGFEWSAIAGGNYANESATPYSYGNFDYGWALPLHHSSIWLRNAAGFAIGDKDEEFSNYYFGGFGNNYVDHQDAKRYREPFSLPGFGIDDLNGRSFARTMLEWNLPPLRFERAGTANFFFSWARPAIFAAALVTNPDDESDTYYSLGTQVDFQFTILSRLDMMFSIGYAAGFDSSSYERDEFMASLKIL